MSSLVVHAFNVSHFQVPNVPKHQLVEQIGFLILILTLFIDFLVDTKNARKCQDIQLAN